MAGGTRQNNTMQEGLFQLLSQLAQFKAAPDADLDFLSEIEAGILAKLKAPQQQALQQLAAAGGVVPGMGAGGGSPFDGGMSPGGAQMGSPMNPMMTQQAPQGPAGVRNGIALPPVDELRRLVASEGLA